MTNIDLKDLSFTAEDFFTATQEPGNSPAEMVANRANALLRERLAKAPVVYGGRSTDFPYTARLVCIEEIK